MKIVFFSRFYAVYQPLSFYSRRDGRWCSLHRDTGTLPITEIWRGKKANVEKTDVRQRRNREGVSAWVKEKLRIFISAARKGNVANDYLYRSLKRSRLSLCKLKSAAVNKFVVARLQFTNYRVVRSRETTPAPLMMRWSLGTTVNYRWITKSCLRASCNPVNRERHRVSWKRIWPHLAWRSRERDKGNLRHNFCDCYNRRPAIELHDADPNRSRRYRALRAAADFRVPTRYAANDTARAVNNNHLVIFIVMVRFTTIDALTYCSGAVPGRLTDCYNAAETSTVTPIWLRSQYAVPIILCAVDT